jgi:hypothetical protein
VIYQKWLTAHFNYTYSHALDETSNGGAFPYGNGGLQEQINPGSLRANNYGNADYDIRNVFNADYVIAPSMHFENKFAEAVLGGWQWSGKVYARSGFPYTVTDGYASPSLVQGGVAVAQVISGGASSSCGAGAAYTNAKITPCLNAAAFANTSVPGFAYTAYPTQTRNQLRGPDYIDFDMALYKTFRLKERYAFGLGATAFNVFNHPNFGLPDNNLGDPFFGQVLYVQGVPVSPYGVGLGFDSSIRIVQLSAKLIF